jgi:hypothetical protein
MIFSSAIDNFFGAPKSIQPSRTECAALHLLRIDLEKIYGSEKRRYIKKNKSPLLASLGIMSGIDLLTKLWVGNISTRSQDFQSFLKSMGSLTANDAEVIYQLRCGLTHNYGLYATDKKYEFILDDSPSNSTLLRRINTKKYHVSFWEMKKLFLGCIKEYESRLRNSNYKNHSDLLNKFMNTVKEIGHFEIK